MNDIAIRVEGLSKRYKIGQRERYQTLRDTLTNLFTAPFRRLSPSPKYQRSVSPSRRRSDSQHIWALKDVSFEVKQGEVVGIIGRNGAGKTTLLKVLSRITEPTEGYAEIRGRVGSLLEVGTGFHPELTGRENIYLSGAILGMKKAEIEKKFDEIVAFAELEKFMDTPVKRYSSGMYVRLAFAVAAHLEPEILLVDEVLAVGDAAFQKKCLGKMGDVAKEGRTVLFVSHNMAAISNLCQSCVLLDKGRLARYGDTESVVSAYLSSPWQGKRINLRDRTDREGDGTLRVTDIYVTDAQGRPIDGLITGRGGQIHMVYESNNYRELRNVSVSISLDTLMGQRVLVLANEYTGDELRSLPERGIIRCIIPNVTLNSGLYTGTIYILVNGILADWVIGAVNITVHAGDFYRTGKHPDSHDGKVLAPHSWDVIPATNE